MNGALSDWSRRSGDSNKAEVVYHPLYGFSLCHGGGYSASGVPDPEHGTSVICGLCGRAGVIPDEGHELEFLPPGTQRAGNGFILNFPLSGAGTVGETEYQRHRRDFWQRWGFDPDPVVHRMLREGVSCFEVVGGTPGERAFLREVLRGAWE